MLFLFSFFFFFFFNLRNKVNNMCFKYQLGKSSVMEKGIVRGSAESTVQMNILLRVADCRLVWSGYQGRPCHLSKGTCHLSWQTLGSGSQELEESP